MYTSNDHTFVICAYKENSYLEQTIKSILNQSIKPNVLISTATPNEFISNLAKKYQIPLYINYGKASIADDWNFGYNQANTKLVTIAHQDDYYERDYLKNVLYFLNKSNNMIITFSDYYEIREGKKCNYNLLLIIKRIMNWGFRVPYMQASKSYRRMILAIGNPIDCPSVVFNKELLKESPFDTKYRNSCDYMTWVKLSSLNGRYIYIPRKLMGHRIYSESETTKNIENNVRKKEDLEIRSLLIPLSIAKIVNKLYALSEKSNNTQ